MVIGRQTQLAEGVGFEPTNPLGLTVFKTVAIVHSAIPPERHTSIVIRGTVGVQAAMARLRRRAGTGYNFRQPNCPERFDAP